MPCHAFSPAEVVVPVRRRFAPALTLLALAVSLLCLLAAVPSRADPHEWGHREDRGPTHSRHHGHGRHHNRERIRDRQFQAHPDVTRRDVRGRLRVGFARTVDDRRDDGHDRGWRDHGWREHRWHERDRWRGWDDRGDDGWSHRSHFFLGFHGPGVWVHGWDDGRYGWWLSLAGSWYFYPNAGLPGPAIVVQTPPTPAQSTTTTPPPPQYWYYCRSAKRYYPYVRQCPNGWQKVPARPSGR